MLKTGFVCPFLYCHGCPFAAFGCPIGILQNSRDFVTFNQFGVILFTLGSLGIYGVIFGRAFCGWGCPFGTLHDLLSPLNRGHKDRTTDYQYLKYAVLLLALTAAWLASDTVFCKFCPSGSLFAALPFRILNSGFSGVGLYFYIHMATLALTVVLAIIVSRFWCRYICPLGAIAGIFNKVGMLRIHLDDSRCKQCNECLEGCVMGISEKEEIGYSTDCILCGRCVERCGEEALSFRWGR